MSSPVINNKDKYADVIIDISHDALDRVFAYRIPETLSGRISPGSRVIVPFGTGNRLICAYVIGVKDRPDYDPDKIKEIVRVEEESLSVEAQLIKVARFLKDRYGASMIRALKTVMPVKSRTRPRTDLVIYPAMDEEDLTALLKAYDRRHATARAGLVDRLLREGSTTKREASKDFGLSLAAIRKMEADGILKTEERVVWRNPYRLEKKGKASLSLNPQQEAAVRSFLADVDAGKPGRYLLHGVTGSGKTEVYLAMSREMVKRGRQVIVLVPEISLTWQTVRRFCEYFGDRIAVLNSRLSKGERYDAAERIRRGEADVVIGPRSALFAPVRDLGLIIIDEEHDPAFKSDQTPKYHAAEVAAYRTRLSGAGLVLGSATPLVESYERARQGRFKLLTLTERAGGAALPRVHLVDLREEFRRGNRSLFSDLLVDKIRNRLEAGEQTMLFVNRRGYAGFISCRECGFVVRCPHCDVSLTVHRDGSLRCHYCGFSERRPAACPSCGSPYIASFGMGTEKVEAEVYETFPGARVLRMDMDTTRRKHAHEEILAAFSRGNADILIGTQMIVKGHDYPNVTLVGVVAADLTLFGQDYRSGEQTFSLLCQAAGRAGRGAKAGEVVIQTYRPDHYAVAAAAAQSYDRFFANESAYRRMMEYPPFGHLLVILIQAGEEEEAALAQDRIRRMLVKSQEGLENPVRILDPGPAMIGKIKDVYRYVLYLKDADRDRLSDLMRRLGDVTDHHELFEKVNVTFDLDPMRTY